MKRIIFALVIFAFAVAVSEAAKAADCIGDVSVDDAVNSTFGPVVQAYAIAMLAANGFETKDDACDKTLSITISALKSSKKINPVGMLFAGGLSSATRLVVRTNVAIAFSDGTNQVYSKSIDYRNSPHDFFSGYHLSRAVKKRVVKEAVAELIAGYLVESGISSSDVKRPVAGTSDFLTEDTDLWPLLGAGLTDLTIHESGHMINARLLGHDPELVGNDSRTFETGPELVMGLSILFAHRIGEDSHLPLLPDVKYDFHPVYTANGMVYVDNDGNTVSNGRRDHSLIAYSGVLYQNLTNEYLLTKHPRLRDEDEPFLKGMFFMNIFLPTFYTVWGYQNENSDLRLLRESLEYDKWAVNTMVLLPSAVDVYRYYHPEKKRLRTYSRIAKIIPVIICLSK